MATQGSNSRLAQMQMRFQKKQQLDREKKLEQIKTIPSSQDVVDNKLSSSFGPGKVRQMFDERRQRGTGIDKSYPLQPITHKSPTSSSTTVKTSSTTVTSIKRQTVGIKQTNNIDVATTNNNLLNKLDGHYLDDNYGDLIDDEKFPDTPLTFDDELVNNKISTKLPNVGKLSLNNSNSHNDFVNNNQINGDHSFNNHSRTSPSGGGSVKLKPVVLKKSTVTNPRRTVASKSSPLSNNRTSQESSPEKRSSSSRSTSGQKPHTITNRPSSKTSSDSLESPSKRISSNTKVMGSVKAPSKQKMVPSGPPPDNSSQCRHCGRYFNEDRVEKHETICQKTQKKRKVFDATKHRVQGTEAEQFVKKSIKNGKTLTNKKDDSSANKKSDWRRKHEEFIQAIRAAKEVQQHLAKGGKLSDLPPPPPSENPDYIQCPHCNRRFNEAAATRHIPKCATMLHNKPKPVARKKF